MAMPLAGPVDGIAEIDDGAAVGLRQTGDEPQQRRFAGTGPAEKPDDLALPQCEIDVIEYRAIRRRPAWEKRGTRRWTSRRDRAVSIIFRPHSRAGICARRTSKAAARIAD